MIVTGYRPWHGETIGELIAQDEDGVTYIVGADWRQFCLIVDAFKNDEDPEIDPPEYMILATYNTTEHP